jgi:phage replication O-like protein O
MASPQLEDGFTPIANEIMEALARHAPGRGEARVLWAVLRKTYGWGKKEDAISISQIEESTELSRRMVIYCLQNLEAKRMITVVRPRGRQSASKDVNRIAFQKNHALWLVQEKSPAYRKALQSRKLNYRKSTREVVQEIRNAKKVVQEIGNDGRFLAPTKETLTKERNTLCVKGKPSRPTDPRVKEFIDWFASGYQERFRQPYHVRGGKDGQLVKSLLRTFGLPELKLRTARLWDSEDPFIARTDRGIGILANQINKLAPTQPAGPKTSEKPPADLTYAHG